MQRRTESIAVIDVLIPAYNVANTLAASLGSIQNQTIEDIRIIVVNDGSTDETAVLLDDIAKHDPRIIVHHQSNAGVVGALNEGLRFCSARYVARHDADDIAFSNRFERQAEYLSRNDDCLAVGANAYHIDESGRRLPTATRFVEKVIGDPYSTPTEEPYLLHPFLFVRRDALVSVGGYRNVFNAQDTDLYWRLFEHGRLHNLVDFLGEYRIHENSVSGRSNLNGRISATNSQLAALSFLRRKAGSPDIVFPDELLAEYKLAASLERIIDVASRQLSQEERRYLKISASAKFLQLVTFRPYMPDVEDCSFVRRVFREEAALISDQNRQIIKLLTRKVTKKLLKKGMLRHVAALGTLAVAPQLIATGGFKAMSRQVHDRGVSN